MDLTAEPGELRRRRIAEALRERSTKAAAAASLGMTSQALHKFVKEHGGPDAFRSPERE